MVQLATVTVWGNAEALNAGFQERVAASLRGAQAAGL
jgi:hypothetical protein